MKNLFKLSLITAFFLLMLFSCDPITEPDQATGRDVHVGELAVSDVFTFTNGETDGGGKAFAEDTSCYQRETEQLGDGSFQTTLTFNNACTMSDGVVRSGQIIIDWEFGWRLDSTKIVVVTFNEFSRDGDVLSGTINIQLLSRINKEYQITENDMKILLSTQEEVTWSGTRTVKWDEGFLTPLDRYDDVKTVNFNKDGVNRNGEKFTSEGVNLVVSNTCDDGKTRIIAGKITITNNTNNNQQTTVEFNGCSDTFTINGIEITP
ncbi:MAG: hypothetical protein JXR68_03160 [Bacteroidales bacterium]|nr:hypothetical protein [Bacteroidales bacterium]